MPASPFLVAVLLAVYFPLGLCVLYLRGGLSAFQFGFLVGDTVLYLGFVFAVLRFFKHDRRFVQTATALIGTDILISVLSIPVTVAGWVSGTSEEVSVLLWVYFALFLWWIDVAGFVLSRAVDQPYIVGLMFVILYVMTSFSINDALTQAPA